MQADGPLTGAPLNFPAPGGTGGCCAPQLKVAADPSPDFSIAQVAGVTIDFIAADCGLDEPLVVTALADPFFGGSVAPVVSSVTVGPLGGVQVVRVLLDSSVATGRFVLQITNACGCCTILTGETIPA